MKTRPSRTQADRALLAAISVSILLSAACAPLGILQDETDIPLAAKIEGQKRIRILTPTAEAKVIRPKVLADGVEGLTPDSGRSIRFSWAEIREIQVRKHGSRLGLGVGSGLGFAAGLAAGVILHGAADGEFNESIVVVGAVGGAAVGALTGALVGSLFNGWRTVFLANAGSRPVPMISLAPIRGRGMALTLAVGF